MVETVEIMLLQEVINHIFVLGRIKLGERNRFEDVKK